MLNGNSEQIDKNLRSWSVTSTSSTNIELSLDFEKPILVSTESSPDIIVIQVFLSEYPESNGYRLPPTVIKKI